MPDKLMVVAHPDDESIFGGAALLSERGWKVICLTNREDETRSEEFHRAMKRVGAAYEIWNYPDLYDGSFDPGQLGKDLEKVIHKHRFGRIVTHNLGGEYGHSQHKSLSKILHGMGIDNLYVFDKSDEVLPFHLLRDKLILLSVYHSQMFVIEQLMPYILYERIVPYDESPLYHPAKKVKLHENRASGPEYYPDSRQRRD
ncbi:PIG-L family deacetylase [Paenibacillus sp. BR2-3]|uniref:PIG-L family deacetylase n=1 Tax=Paenibacillus sp. BR2-3 TaxID=3048494 RepID=UPI003977553B